MIQATKNNIFVELKIKISEKMKKIIQNKWMLDIVQT
jgi:hypothetical protein